MQTRLPLELIEEILVQAILLDPERTDPLPLLHVLPGLGHLRRVVLRYFLHARVQRALEFDNKELRGLLIQHRQPCSDPAQFNFYRCLLCADDRFELMEQCMDRDWIELGPPYLADVATACGRHLIIDWLHESGRIGKYKAYGLNQACADGDLDTLY
ncbi:hypothetical protein H9P43_007921 [Blastocladiella emersonii ATCC 22665]|nr:hypothetical protein H9P43_007921 [Blastocladiella emersonii ATCC 22665]